MGVVLFHERYLIFVHGFVFLFFLIIISLFLVHGFPT